MPSNAEMSDCSQSENEPEQVPILPHAPAACKQDPQSIVFKGNQYNWKQHEDNERAFSHLAGR